VLCRVFRRNALHVRWPVLGCVLLALVVAALNVSWRLATGPSVADRGQLMVGFNVAASADWLAFSFLPKFATALGIGLLLIKRAQGQLEIKV
jgi:hypothetical protein